MTEQNNHKKSGSGSLTQWAKDNESRTSNTDKYSKPSLEFTETQDNTEEYIPYTLNLDKMDDLNKTFKKKSSFVTNGNTYKKQDSKNKSFRRKIEEIKIARTAIIEATNKFSSGKIQFNKTEQNIVQQQLEVLTQNLIYILILKKLRKKPLNKVKK